MKKQLLAVSLLGLIASFCWSGCKTECQAGSICGDRNSVAPTTVVTTTTTTQASPSPSPSACVPQTAPFICSSGSPIFEAIVLDTQQSVPAAPEPIYVGNLVAAFNKRSDVCAIAGPAADQVTLKARSSNTLSETWDVVREDGAIQAIPAKPLNICVPSRF